MTTLDELIAQVTKNVSAEASAVTLIKGLADEIAQAGGNPPKLAELTAQLKASADALAQAITANTPAAPPPVVTPPATP